MLGGRLRARRSRCQLGSRHTDRSRHESRKDERRAAGASPRKQTVIGCPPMSRRLAWSLGLLSFIGCGSVAPPRSQLPSAEAALERLRETGRCEVAIQASAKIEHEGEHGRVKGDLLMFAAVPD